jgi:hypothetical protein
MTENRRLSHSLVLAAATSLVCAAAGQRPTAAIEFQDRSAGVEYGAVRVGKHSIDELEPGATWRMGFNDASVLKTELPLLAGDTLVAPGSYRVAVFREQADTLFLRLAEAAKARTASGDEFLRGELARADKPNDRLAIDWTTKAKGKGEQDFVRATTVDVRFGAHRLTVPVTLVGARPAKVPGWKIDVFTIPADVLKERIGRGLLTPVAALKSAKDRRKAPASFNLFVGKDGASLVPALEAPTESYGFAPVAAPDPAWIRNGRVEIAETEADKAALEAVKLGRQGKDLSLVFAFGDRRLSVVIPEPDRPATARSGKK